MIRFANKARAARRRYCSVMGLGVAVFLHACTGNVLVEGDLSGEGVGGGDPGDSPRACAEEEPCSASALAAPSALGAAYARRLTRWELQNAFSELVDVPTSETVELLPADTINATVSEEGIVTPFDNDFTLQKPSEVLARNLLAIAEEVSAAAIARARENAGYADALFGCTPSGPEDSDCMEGFVRDFGRRVLRRPLDAAEVYDVAGLALDVAQADGDFFAGARYALWALFADLEFIYRVEHGVPVEGRDDLFELGSYELATRLSFLVWGSIPDVELLDAAEAGELGSAAGIAREFDRMVEDPRAAKQLAHFHELWFGYTEGIPVSEEISRAMHAESEALFDRILLRESGNWFDLVRAEETFVSPELAAHYEMPVPEESAWVRYPEGERAGFFGHGTFLAFGALAGDTSPTRRGILIQENLFCHHIPAPTPDQLAALGAEDVNVDAPPPGDGCKSDRYAMHAQGGCASCHQYTDPVGFGLERFDTAGAYRTHEEGKPECEIDGQGSLREQPFSGPRGLANVVLQEQEAIAECMSRQALQYILGRAHLPNAGWDDALLREELGSELATSEFSLVNMLRSLATSLAFRHRVEATEQEGTL